MKKEDNQDLGFPWGFIAFVSFLAGLVFSSLAMSGIMFDWAAEGLVASVVIFSISLLVWLLKLGNKWSKMEKKESSWPLPWWYGGL